MKISYVLEQVCWGVICAMGMAYVIWIAVLVISWAARSKAELYGFTVAFLLLLWSGVGIIVCRHYQNK